MTEVLYTPQILRLASSIPHHQLLATPHARVRKHSPICGSKITIDIVVHEGRVADFGQEVRACALGQASASLLGAHIMGATITDLTAVCAALRAFLQGNGPVPSGRFLGLDIFRPAIPYKARHASILLGFDATLEGFEQTQTRHHTTSLHFEQK